MTIAADVERWDAIVIGAGLSGMYQLLRLREQGFRVRAYEAGGDVGGTWYWNRYPGCRFDSESWTYGFSFSPEVLKEWDWKEHFSGQPENLRYCNFLADKFDLRRDITFGARVKAAQWDDAAGEWEVLFEDGRRARARFMITAIGPLSTPTMPVIEGAGDFKGESYHTGLWPHHPVSFAGKRVAVIGTGASGVQTITEIAKTVGHLTVFQRTPNWCTPLRNGTTSEDRANQIHYVYNDANSLREAVRKAGSDQPRASKSLTTRTSRILRPLPMRAGSTVQAALVIAMRPFTIGPAAARSARVGVSPAAGPERKARAASIGEA